MRISDLKRYLDALPEHAQVQGNVVVRTFTRFEKSRTDAAEVFYNPERMELVIVPEPD